MKLTLTLRRWRLAPVLPRFFFRSVDMSIVYSYKEYPSSFFVFVPNYSIVTITTAEARAREPSIAVRATGNTPTLSKTCVVDDIPPATGTRSHVSAKYQCPVTVSPSSTSVTEPENVTDVPRVRVIDAAPNIVAIGG